MEIGHIDGAGLQSRRHAQMAIMNHASASHCLEAVSLTSCKLHGHGAGGDKAREWRWITGSNTLMNQSIILKLACYGAAVALCLVTMAANLNFGMTLGATPEEKIVYAIASVAAD